LATGCLATGMGVSTSAPRGDVSARRRRALTVTALCMTVTAIAFESISVATAMPAAARALHGLHLYAWAFSLFLIGQLFATVAAGRLCDRFGPARPMAGGLALFTVGLVVAATAPSMPQLIVGRLLQGLGAGTIGISLYVVIALAFEPVQRPTVFSFFSTAWVLPSFVGPAIAAWLTGRLGWQSVFWAVVPLVGLGAAIILPLVFRLPGPDRSADRATRPTALWAASLAALGATALQVAGQRPTAAGLLVGVAGLVMVGASLPNLMPPGFFRFRPGLAPVITVRGLMAGAFFGAEAFVPLMLVEQRHLSLLAAGSSLTVGALGWTAGSWTQSRPTLPFRRDQLITLGATSLVLGIALVTLTTALRLSVGLVAVGWVLAGAGMGLATASTAVATMTLSATAEQGRNASSLQFADAFGAGLFVGAGGTVFAVLRGSHTLTTVFTGVLATMTVVAVLAVVASSRTGPIRDTPPASG
jgi:MFS family permease